jgi:hypothetical protein
VQILKDRIWIPVLVLILAVFASSSVFAGSVVENSDEPAFEQEANLGDNEPISDAEDVLTLREIDESAYTIIETPEIPLAASPFLGSWAFVNLLMAIIGLIISALTVIVLLAGKGLRGEVSDEYGPRNTMLLKLIGASIGVASVVLFLLTEDVHGVMRSVDGLTWMMALIVFIQIAIVAVSFGIDKRLRGARPPSL